MNLITNKKEKRSVLASIYKNNFKANLNDFNLKKAIFFGVKYINYVDFKDFTYEELKELMNHCYIIDDLISVCSIYTFENIFPIEKEFDGWKYESKDYFSTQDYLKDKDKSKLILEYNIDEFLSYYYNNTIIDFLVKKFMICDAILKKQGKTSLMQQFSKQFNVPCYTKIDDNTFINQQTNEVLKVNDEKRVPYIFKNF